MTNELWNASGVNDFDLSAAKIDSTKMIDEAYVEIENLFTYYFATTLNGLI